MAVEGFHVDTIESLEEPALNGVIPREWREAAITAADQIEDAESATRHVPEWNDIPDIFWRTLVADRGPHGNLPPGWYRRACEEAYCRSHDNFGDLNTSNLIEFPLDDGSSTKVTEFLQRVQAVTWSGRFIVTEDESIGLVPKEAQEGDIICILFGCTVPVVLRQHEEGPDNILEEFIGECYIHSAQGIMDGRAMEQGKYRATVFKIK